MVQESRGSEAPLVNFRAKFQSVLDRDLGAIRQDPGRQRDTDPIEKQDEGVRRQCT